MDISGLSGLGTSSAQASQSQLSSNFDMFLRLLTTQLQNQDPLQPTDTNQFTQQLVQYSQVEQQIKSNDQLTKLVGMQSNLQLQSALSYIGMDVRIAGDTFNYENGDFTFDYGFNGNAARARINILNEEGETVFTTNGALEGDTLHHYTWDGKDINGLDVPPGEYKIQIALLDAEGKAMTAETAVWGQVTGMEILNGQAILKMGEIPVSMDAVLAAQLRQSSI